MTYLWSAGSSIQSKYMYKHHEIYQITDFWQGWSTILWGGDYVTKLADSQRESTKLGCEILIANGAFWNNLDHQIKAEISPIFSQYFS